MRSKLLVMLAVTCSSAALAGPREWTLSEASGPVQVSHAGLIKAGARGLVVAAGALFVGGRTGSVRAG